jgi:hypothetical protein
MSFEQNPDANQCASDSRVQRPKNFRAFFSRLLPPLLCREAGRESVQTIQKIAKSLGVPMEDLVK